MIEDIKNNYVKNNIQFIKTTRDGIVLESENTLFNILVGASIFKFHSFFESIQYYFNEASGKEFKLSCINIETENKTGIFDVHIYIKESEIIMAMFDFTDHYKLSKELSQEKNESVIHAQILKERETFKNRFLANTSHELRSPLSTIMGFTSILSRSSLTLSQLHNLNVIKSSSEHLKNIIDDILQISKIELGELKIEKTRFNFIAFYEHIEDIYVDKFKDKRIKFSTKIDKNIPQFLIGDKFRLNQIIRNILDNALKFTKVGRVSLKVKATKVFNENIQLTFEIKDTGIGIPKKDLKAIFESFTQVNNTSRNNGTGLGLSIVKHLVSLMSGEVYVKSIEYKGSTFSVVLDFEVSEDQNEVVVLESKIDTTYKGKKYNILIAEDLEINQLLLIKILSDYKKYYFDIASNGDQVIDLLVKNKYDLILMDLKMPTMDGYDTTRFIRHSELVQFSDIPIIAVTAKVSPLERERCLNSGMNEYIAKPFTEEELISKINEILGEN